MSERLRVGIIMGSDSDLSVMRHVGLALMAFGLNSNADYEERIISAHRTPEQMTVYAKTAMDRGLQVIVAGAGGSAHLPGMVASETILPVFGVAITQSPDTLNRALGSMIGMPKGKPLATFQGEAGAFNAGLLAVRLLALSDSKLREACQEYNLAMTRDTTIKDALLQSLGAEEYLSRPPS